MKVPPNLNKPAANVLNKLFDFLLHPIFICFAAPSTSHSCAILFPLITALLKLKSPDAEIMSHSLGRFIELQYGTIARAKWLQQFHHRQVSNGPEHEAAVPSTFDSTGRCLCVSGLLWPTIPKKSKSVYFYGFHSHFTALLHAAVLTATSYTDFFCLTGYKHAS